MQALNKPEDLNQMRRDGHDPVLINVLSEDSFHKAHIPGSRNVPVDRDDFTETVERLLGGKKDRPVVVYCANRACDASPRAARRLEQAGFSKVYDFEGGVKAWQEAGLELNGSVVSDGKEAS